MYIHEQDNWTNFQYDSQKLIDLIAQVSLSVGTFNGRLKSIGFNDQLISSVETAAVNIVASSEVEGISLNTAEVRSSVAKKLGVTIKEDKTPSHYVEGIVDMFLDAVMNFQQPLTHERLFGWHRLLFPHSDNNNSDLHVGQYRTNEMSVVSGMYGRERIHYRAVSPEKVPQEMDAFIRWFNDSSIKPSFLKSAIAHLWFVSIHPFDDGNGRIARALSDMIFAQIEETGRRFFSISKQINIDKKHYYEVLERTQRGDGEITEWISWYLHCIEDAVKDADALLNIVLRKAIFWRNHTDLIVSARQKEVLNLFLDGYDAKLTIKSWSKLADISKDTASRDINDLVDKGVLKATQGKVRNVSYSILYVSPEKSSVFEDVCISDQQISVSYGGGRYTDQLLKTDQIRLATEEVSKEDLAFKYFAYLLE